MTLRGRHKRRFDLFLVNKSFSAGPLHCFVLTADRVTQRLSPEISSFGVEQREHSQLITNRGLSR